MGTNTAESIETSTPMVLLDRINQSNKLSPRNKTEVLIKIVGRGKTMWEGVRFMMQHQLIRFDDFERAWSALSNEANTDNVNQIKINNEYSLGKVEVALQSQIDVILRMSDKDLSKEEKALCLYTLQNIIFGFKDYEFKKGAERYEPQILRELYKLLEKAAILGMSREQVEQLRESCYTTEYRDFSNPTLKDWKFLDRNLILKNMKSLEQNSGLNVDNQTNENNIDNGAKGTKTPQINQGITTWNNSEYVNVPDVDINQIINQVLHRFDAINIRENVQEVYNFVKDSLTAQSKNPELLNRQTFLQITKVALQNIVNIGSDLQRKAMFEQQQGGMTL